MAQQRAKSQDQLPVVPSAKADSSTVGPCGLSFGATSCQWRRSVLASGQGLTPKQIEECSTCRHNPLPIVSTRATPASVLSVIEGVVNRDPMSLPELLEDLDSRIERIIRLWDAGQRERFRRALKLHKPEKEALVPIDVAKRLKQLLTRK